jgi:glycerophosphoryl diester phosphodiesterase
VVAHRGASDRAPENSIAAFGLALRQGTDLIETDLWQSEDGELLCFHDATLERMTGDPRRIDGVSAAELRRLRLREHPDGFGDERIPTLEELLDLVPDDIGLLLELKDPRFVTPTRARRLAEAIHERAEQGTVAVISFDYALVRAVERQLPRLITGCITKRNPLPTRSADLLGPYWPLLVLNPWYVRMAHALGKRVCPLDPGLHQRLARYLALDVDAVLTNDPAATRARIETLRG